MSETEYLMSVPENRERLMQSKGQLEKGRAMRTYTEAVQELASILSLRLRGGVETLAFLFEIDVAEVKDDVRAAAALDGLESGL